MLLSLIESENCIYDTHSRCSDASAGEAGSMSICFGVPGELILMKFSPLFSSSDKPWINFGDQDKTRVCMKQSFLFRIDELVSDLAFFLVVSLEQFLHSLELLPQFLHFAEDHRALRQSGTVQIVRSAPATYHGGTYSGNLLTSSSNLVVLICPPSSSHSGSSTFGSPSSSGGGPLKYARIRSLREWES